MEAIYTQREREREREREVDDCKRGPLYTWAPCSLPSPTPTKFPKRRDSRSEWKQRRQREKESRGWVKKENKRVGYSFGKLIPRWRAIVGAFETSSPHSGHLPRGLCNHHTRQRPRYSSVRSNGFVRDALNRLRESIVPCNDPAITLGQRWLSVFWNYHSALTTSSFFSSGWLIRALHSVDWAFLRYFWELIDHVAIDQFSSSFDFDRTFTIRSRLLKIGVYYHFHWCRRNHVTTVIVNHDIATEGRIVMCS